MRIPVPFPAVVRGVDDKGEAFEAVTVLDNLSAGGLYAPLIRRVNQGARLFVVIQLLLASGEKARSRLAVRGVVSRVELASSGAWATAVAFRNHRFLKGVDSSFI